ncbi:MAG TPA: maleylpyruvate isomerase family mycothiol-dependent enzyme, partial [Acidimicrobiales bacterium]|nr:maleylpyruvate isomerase family mycothiol-dependent enzyme [Acidimicrobiales bacterium]
MQEVTAALADEHGALAAMLGGVDADGWAAPSRCPGWSVSDVVLHLAQTDEMAVASLDGTFDAVLARFAEGLGPAADVDAGAGAAVERERGASGPEVFTRWQV